MKIEITDSDHRTIIAFLSEARDKAMSASLGQLVLELDGLIKRLYEGRASTSKKETLIEKGVK